MKDADPTSYDHAQQYCTDNSREKIGGQHGYNPYTANVPITDLYVSRSKAGERAGRGVFTSVDIPPNTYVGLETTVYGVMYEWKSSELIEQMKNSNSNNNNNNNNMTIININHRGSILYVFGEAYGYSAHLWGTDRSQEFVASHLTTFTNHGCNGTFNLDEVDVEYTEFTIRTDHVPKELQWKNPMKYNPYHDRDYMKDATSSRSGKFIGRDEELLDNYMSFGGDEYFMEMIEDLRVECSGGSGVVEQYQQGLYH
jgi:hypothetical protein